jgi:hypothetical protein
MILYGYEHMIMMCTYLNSHLLGAPREYVLYGLDSGLGRASFWPSTPHAFHVPHPTRYLAACPKWIRFHTYLLHCYLGGFSLMYKKTTQQRYMTHMETHIYITSALLFFFLLFFLHLFYLSW